MHPAQLSTTTAALQEVLDRLSRRPHIPHVIAAVQSGDGAFRWTGVAGSRPNGARLSAQTPFFIASVDKLFTAAVMLRLCERKLASLESSICDYLPSNLVAGLHTWKGVDHTSKLTVRNLLAHTSGLPDYLEERPKDGRSLVERLFEEGDLEWTTEDALRAVRERFVPHFAPQPSEARRPRVRYSDTNYLLLIALIETITAQPLESVYTDLLFRPLGMRQTWLSGRSEPLDPAPPPAPLWLDSLPLNLPLAMRALYSIYSTADDALQFLGALLNGKFFDSPSTLALMQQRWNRFGLPRDMAGLRAPSWPIQYGLGIMRFQLPRILTPLRPIPALIGHSGSTGSWLFYCPELDLYFCGTADQVTAGAVPYRVLPRFLRVLRSVGTQSRNAGPQN